MLLDLASVASAGLKLEKQFSDSPYYESKILGSLVKAESYAT